MFFTLFDSRYRKIYEDVNEATSLIESERFEQSLKLSDKALEYISSECRGVKDKNLFLAKSELLLIRAVSKTRVYPIDDYPTQSVMTDFNEAMRLLEGTAGYHRACIFAGEYLLKLSAMSKSDHTGQAYSLLMQGNQAAESFAETSLEEKHLARASLAKCFGLKQPTNSHYDIDRAITLMTDAHQYFISNDDQNHLVELKHYLVGFHREKYFETGSLMDLEKAIQYLKELTTIVDPEDSAVGPLIASMGKTILLRKRSFRKQDIEAALQILNTAIGYFDKESDFEGWASVAGDLVESAILLKTYYPNIVESDEVMTASLKIINEITNNPEIKCYPLIRYQAYGLIDKLKSWYPDEVLPDEEDLLSNLSKDLSNEPDWTDLYVETVIRLSNRKDTCEAIEILEIALEDIDKTKWIQSYLDICFELSKRFINQDDHDKAVPYLLKSLEIVSERREFYDRNNLSKARGLVLLHDREVVKIPFSLLQSGYLKEAIWALEILRFHPVNPVLEELLVINKQIDRKRWLLQHKCTKQFELFMQARPKSETDQQSDLIDFQQELAKKSQDLTKAENYYRDVTQLIEKNRKYSEFKFLEDLKTSIRRTSNWILLPLFSSHDMRIVLVPPKELDLNLFVFDGLSIGYIEVLKMLTEGEHAGWMGSAMNHSSEISLIQDNPNIPDFKKNALLQNFYDVRYEAFEKMKCFLYEAIWEKALPVILHHGGNELRSVVVVAQGPFSTLPFCMASKISSETYVVDELNVSYAPSLYSLYALTERLEETDYKDTVAFLMQEYEGDDSNVLESVPIERDLIGNTFGEDHTRVGVIEPTSIGESCADASYWHFSTHGSFSWHDYSESKIEWTNSSRDAKIDLTPELLAGFGSRASLRLITLSACQTGVPEFLDKELSPESFLTELLKSGAIGAIGTLWEAPDLATALILARVYHFHIKLKQTPAQSLQSAQLWLRDISCSKLCEFLETNLPTLENKDALITELKSEFEDQEKKPFQSPLYWASFVLVGI